MRIVAVLLAATAIVSANAETYQGIPGAVDGAASAKSSGSNALKVPESVRLVAMETTETRGKDQYLQFVLLPPDTGGVAAIKQARWWEKVLTYIWNDSRAASVFFQVEVQTLDGRVRSVELPVTVVTRTTTVSDAEVKPIFGELSGHYYTPTNAKAYALIKLAYARKVETKLISTGLELIPLIQPAFGWPAKYAAIAVRDSTVKAGHKADTTVGKLLSDEQTIPTVLTFDIGKLKGFELRDEQTGTVLAKISLESTSTLLASDIHKFPDHDMATLLRFRKGADKSVGELMNSAAAVNSLEAFGSFQSACDRLEQMLVTTGFAPVDRAALMTSWLLSNDFNVLKNRAPGKTRISCERYTRSRLLGTNIGEMIKTREELEENAPDTTALTSQEIASYKKAYARLTQAFGSANAEIINGVLGNQVKISTAVNADGLKSPPLTLVTPDVAENTFDQEEVSEAVRTKKLGYDRKGRTSCFTLLDNAQPTVLRASCFTLDGKPVDVTVTTNRSVFSKPDEVRIVDLRFKRWLPQ